MGRVGCERFNARQRGLMLLFLLGLGVPGLTRLELLELSLQGLLLRVRLPLLWLRLWSALNCPD